MRQRGRYNRFVRPLFPITDPAVNEATSSSVIDVYGGALITLTAAGNAQTLQSPSNLTAGKTFSILNNDTSVDDLFVNGIDVNPGETISFIWDGTAWLEYAEPVGPSLAIQDEGTPVEAEAALVNFTGTGVTATSIAAGQVQVDIPLEVSEIETGAVWVNVGASPTGANGSFAKPYINIQDAINYIETNGSPSELNPWNIFIFPGIYQENLVIHYDGINLIGLGNPRSVRVEPTSGWALILTNATAASLTTYQSSGVYSDLVNQGDGGPKNNVFSRVAFQVRDANAYAVGLLGVKGDATASTTYFGYTFFFYDCLIDSRSPGSQLKLIYARNLYGVNLTRCEATIEAFNAGFFEIYHSQIGVFLDEYDNTDSEGYSEWNPYSYGTITMFYTWIFDYLQTEGDIRCENTITNCQISRVFLLDNTFFSALNCYIERYFYIYNNAVVDSLRDTSIVEDVICANSSSFSMIGGVIGRDVSCSGNSSFYSEDVHVQGDVYFAPLAGTAEMNGGQYMGTLTDTAGKLVRNFGDTALIVEDEGSSIDSQVTNIDFTGTGVTATQTAAGQVQVDIPLEVSDVVTGTMWISSGANPTGANGSFAKPYPNIQDAVDWVEANGSPSYLNPWNIIIFPGVYHENVVIHMDGINLVGLAQPIDTKIEPVTGSPVIFTNATDASLTTYLSSGNYADLVNQGNAGPQINQITAIACYSNLGYIPIQFLGVKGDSSPNTTLFGTGFVAQNCTFLVKGASAGYGGYARNVNDISLILNPLLETGLIYFNVGRIRIRDTIQYEHSNIFDLSDSEGYPHLYSSGVGFEFIINSTFSTTVIENIHTITNTNSNFLSSLTLNGNSSWDGTTLNIGSNVFLNDTSSLELVGSQIEGSVFCTALASFSFESVYVRANLVIDSSAIPLQMKGGAYLGILYDGSGRLNRDFGDTALAIEDEGVEVDPQVTNIDFTGAGVTATQTAAGQVQVDIPLEVSEVETGIMWVSAGASPTGANGSFAKPYPSIQDAVDWVETNGSPSSSNPWNMIIFPGLYQENVLIRSDGINLLGLSHPSSTRIEPVSGDGITFTNATYASYQTWLISGSYSDLVNQGDAGPSNNKITGISSTLSPGVYCVRFMGVKGDASPDSTLFSENILIQNCTFTISGDYAIFARNANDITISNCPEFGSGINAFNVGNIPLINTLMDRFAHAFYQTNPEGYPDNYNYGYAFSTMQYSAVRFLTFTNVRSDSHINMQYRAIVTLNGDSQLRGEQLSFSSDLVANDTSAIFIRGASYIDGDVLCGGDTSFYAQDTHIVGNLSFLSGAGTAEMDGGQYMGTLTDPDGKLVRNFGDTALEIEGQGSSIDSQVTNIDFVGTDVTVTQTATGQVEVNVSNHPRIVRLSDFSPPAYPADCTTEMQAWADDLADPLLSNVAQSVIGIIEPGRYSINDTIDLPVSYNCVIEAYGAQIVITQPKLMFDLNPSANPLGGTEFTDLSKHFYWFGGHLSPEPVDINAIGFRAYGMERCGIRDVTLFRFGDTAVQLCPTQVFEVSDCNFFNCSYCIDIPDFYTVSEYPIGISIRNCFFEDHSDTAIRSDREITNFSVTGCEFVGPGALILQTGRHTQTKGLLISNCLFREGTSYHTQYIRFRNSYAQIAENVSIRGGSFFGTSLDVLEAIAINGLNVESNLIESSNEGSIDILGGCNNVLFSNNSFTNLSLVTEAINVNITRSFIITSEAFQHIDPPVPLLNWAGASRSSSFGTIVMRTEAGANYPRMISPRKWVFNLAMRDSGSATGSAHIRLRKEFSASAFNGANLILDGDPNDTWEYAEVTVDCPASGNIFYEVLATGVDTAEVYIILKGVIL